MLVVNWSTVIVAQSDKRFKWFQTHRLSDCVRDALKIRALLWVVFTLTLSYISIQAAVPACLRRGNVSIRCLGMKICSWQIHFALNECYKSKIYFIAT